MKKYKYFKINEGTYIAYMDNPYRMFSLGVAHEEMLLEIINIRDNCVMGYYKEDGKDYVLRVCANKDSGILYRDEDELLVDNL